MKKINIFNSVFIVSIFSLLNFALSALLQILLAAFFGAKIEMDAYVVAMTIPMIITGLLTSYEVIFVPMFKNYSLTIDENKFNALLSTIFNLSALILIAVSVAGFFLAPKLVSILSPGFSPQAKELTQALLRILLPSVVFSGLATFLMSTYHFKGKFILPAVAPVANMSIIIVTTLFLYPLIGIRGLALSTLCASVIQLLILFPGFLRREQYRFVINMRHKELLQFHRKFLYLGIGGLFLGFILILEKFLASRLPEGTIATLSYAGKVTSLILLLPSAAISTVILPELSKHYTLNDLKSLKLLVSRSIRMSFLCVFPVTVILLVFREPIIKLLLERGLFDKAAVNNTSLALLCYSGLLIGTGMNKVVSMGFFAMHDFLTPSLIMVFAFLFYASIAPFLSRIFSFQGLAMSFSLAAIVSIIIYVVIIRQRLSGIEGRKILSSSSKVIVSSLIMGVISAFIFRNLPSFFIWGQDFTLIARMGISLLIGTAAFNITAFILRLDELRFVYELVYLRLKMFRKR